MTSWLVPAGIVAGSLILTYLCCLRPIRDRHLSLNGAKRSSDRCCTGSSADTDLDDALNRARSELAHLTSELGAVSATHSGSDTS